MKNEKLIVIKSFIVIFILNTEIPSIDEIHLITMNDDK